MPSYPGNTNSLSILEVGPETRLLWTLKSFPNRNNALTWYAAGSFSPCRDQVGNGHVSNNDPIGSNRNRAALFLIAHVPASLNNDVVQPRTAGETIVARPEETGSEAKGSDRIFSPSHSGSPVHF